MRTFYRLNNHFVQLKKLMRVSYRAAAVIYVTGDVHKIYENMRSENKIQNLKISAAKILDEVIQKFK